MESRIGRAAMERPIQHLYRPSGLGILHVYKEVECPTSPLG
jgi:hypothetical protein